MNRRLISVMSSASVMFVPTSFVPGESKMQMLAPDAMTLGRASDELR
ncbi:hypothetical protein HQO27_05885 [Rhodococcus fascians]|nr:hypothetical protein [Rhodococcus fascians]MBY4430294.1 hypothetical protein [Rhodococcus fascians]